MSERDVREAYQLLALLESDAAARVASKATDEQLQELQGLHQLLEQQVLQREAFFAVNERFHVRLLEIEGNRWRQQIITDLRRVMKLNRHNSLFKQGRLEESLAEHRALVDALAQRDAPACAQLMREHFQNGLAATSPTSDR
jgi:DNA-binding GntR family transcriptional regulator